MSLLCNGFKENYHVQFFNDKNKILAYYLVTNFH